jgi:hypothetical protein
LTVLGLAGMPSAVGPSLVIVAGVGWGVLAGYIVVNAERHFAATRGVPLGKGLDDLTEDQISPDRPFMVWTPFLVTAGWIDILIGLVWLAFVDLRVMLGAIVVLVIVWFALKWWPGRAALVGGP